MQSDGATRRAFESPECMVCPLCIGMSMLRQSKPEAIEHLVKAGGELLLAVRALLDGTEPSHEQPHRAGGAQRIDVA